MVKRGLVSAVVVDWQGMLFLRDCLNSLLVQTYKNWEVILIENEPRDDFLKEIENSFPHTKIIVNRKNIFYSSAQNQGINAAEGEFILSLNNDVVLDNNFLAEAVKSMESDKKIGIVSGKLLSFDGKFLDSTGQFLGYTRRPIERGHRERDLGKFDKPEFVFGACGACALYRKKMLEEIKIRDGEYFDAEYGLFYEDLDLNWRANRFGWRAYYNPKAIAYHLRGSSVRLNKPAFSLFRYFQFCCLSPEHKLMLFKNRYATLIKNETLITFLRNFFFVFLYDFCLWFYIFLFEPNLVLKFSKEVKFLYSSFKKRR